MWDIVIILIVVSAALGSAALPGAALVHWRGLWRVGAGLPFIGLVLWGGGSAVGCALRVDATLSGCASALITSYTGWMLGLFAWAMLTLVYMMGLLTARRIIGKGESSD